MGMIFEPFERGISGIRQTRDARTLVRRSEDWLMESPYRGDTRRYGTLLHALWNVWQLAGRSDVQVGILYDTVASQQHYRKGNAAGLGMLVAKQALRHPDTGERVAGTALDYWLSSRYRSPGTHKLAAQCLIEAASEASKPTPVFATIDPDRSNQPYGFQGRLQPVGDPARLELAGASLAQNITDTYGLLKGGVMLQLYKSA